MSNATSNLRSQLERIAEELICGVHSPDDAHYCPNCDNSLFGVRAKVRALIAALPVETTCEWSEIEDGSGVFNTCKAGEEWHVPEGLEPYPFCHWCGKRVVIAEPACTECGAKWGEHRAGCSQIDPADLPAQVKTSVPQAGSSGSSGN